jgi:hypothetical protein
MSCVPFDPAALYALRLPGQLSQATVADIVLAVTALGRSMPLDVAKALTALLDSHRESDARNLVHALEVSGSPDLAAAIDQALLD